ncbi:glycosyl hydrolase [Legionella jordanis]|uniref:glucan endo-1,3-beta-D-glucosidase n=2 Tax=Legionella jordanis TaxID=456 RepID=A0A0W0VBQ6_9GAMM|nr:glycosyl hydrolase [Legionella jordanis]KTD17286.1 Glycosyl hydrolase family 81 [Legionella jordanis]VEH12515.1 Glycosyl hydrolase family 81 [Legionella jordanis]
MGFQAQVILLLGSLLLVQACQCHPSKFFDPGNAFPSTLNELQPSSYWLDNKKPFATNAWFINLVLKQSSSSFSNPVNQFPYLIKTSAKGISLSYTGPNFYAEPAYPNIVSALYYQFSDQLTLGPLESMPSYGLENYHGLQIQLSWKNHLEQKMTSPLLQGSPYITQMFVNATPKLHSNYKWLSINNQTKPGILATNTRYEVVQALDEHNTQTWLLYSEKSLQFHWKISKEGQELVATNPYSGWIRLVLQKDSSMGIENDAATLDNYSQTIPLDYQQHYTVNPSNLIYSFSWTTQNGQPPLMLSLPHQRNSSTSSLINYFGIKGLLRGETSSKWEIVLPKVPIQFLEPKRMSGEQLLPLRAALRSEANQLLTQPFPDDGPYRVGKRYARAARLILIARRLKESRLEKAMLQFIEKRLSEKMKGQSSWHFEYDTTWGGIIPSVNDYGARHYTDHHFHYGYWVYTFAVIAKLDPHWLNRIVKGKPFSPKQWIDCLIRDFANENKDDPYFPVQRYQDDYSGHSWASGLTSFVDGQNEQSSSEAVNAYYSLALYGRAIHDKSLLNWAQFLMNRELKAAQLYWQVKRNNSIYPEQFKANNQVVANLWQNKIDANAFFKACNKGYRCGIEFSYGIEMLPFNAISLQLLDRDWLKEIYPLIKKLITNQYATISPAWKWLLIKGLAPIMDETEKAYYFKQVMDSNQEEYDNGDSKTNTLYFLIND